MLCAWMFERWIVKSILLFCLLFVIYIFMASLPRPPLLSIIIAKYASGYYSVALAMWWSTQDLTYMNGSPHLTIGHLLRGESRMHV